MKPITIDQLKNNDEVALVFPPDNQATYGVITGNFKSFTYKNPEVTGNNELTVFLNNTTELVINALDGTRIDRDTSSVLNLTISEQDQADIKVYLLHEEGWKA